LHGMGLCNSSSEPDITAPKKSSASTSKLTCPRPGALSSSKQSSTDSTSSLPPSDSASLAVPSSSSSSTNTSYSTASSSSSSSSFREDHDVDGEKVRPPLSPSSAQRKFEEERLKRASSEEPLQIAAPLRAMASNTKAHQAQIEVKQGSKKRLLTPIDEKKNAREAKLCPFFELGKPCDLMKDKIHCEEYAHPLSTLPSSASKLSDRDSNVSSEGRSSDDASRASSEVLYSWTGFSGPERASSPSPKSSLSSGNPQDSLSVSGRASAPGGGIPQDSVLFALQDHLTVA